MNLLTKYLRQIEAAAEQIHEIQHELVNATNSTTNATTVLDYWQYRLSE